MNDTSENEPTRGDELLHLSLGYDELGNPLTDEERKDVARWAHLEIMGLRWCVRMLWEKMQIIDPPGRTWQGKKTGTHSLEDVITGGNAEYADRALRATGWSSADD
jgi:hypothetical protein